VCENLFIMNDVIQLFGHFHVGTSVIPFP